MTGVYFVRHAQPDRSNHDEAERSLSPQGLRDRVLVTEYLSKQHICAVYSSPYRRAIETVEPFAQSAGLEIVIENDFRERKITNGWIADFDGFCKSQWNDFSWKLEGGESLAEVQQRNHAALMTILERHRNENIAVGSHGTAMSTLIKFYVPGFSYKDFARIKSLMPWIVRFDFEGMQFVKMEEIDLLDLL